MSTKKRARSPTKQLVPFKPISLLEKKLNSHIPTSISGHQPTKRKSPRKASPKKVVKQATFTKARCGSPKNYNQIDYTPVSPQRKYISPISSPKRKKSSNDNGRISPTKRMIDMKNSYIKNQKKAMKDPANFGKMIYTISPNEAYIVDQEFHHSMENEDIAKKSNELCQSADKERSKYGDSMVKHRSKKTFY
jgi:hypothetical protein